MEEGMVLPTLNKASIICRRLLLLLISLQQTDPILHDAKPCILDSEMLVLNFYYYSQPRLLWVVAVE